MILLDANVPIYAQGRDHPYRESCRAIIDQINAGTQSYAIDTETLQEILYYYTRQEEVSRGIQIVEDLLPRFTDIIPITATEITTAMRLLADTPGLSSRDAIHAAVVMGHGLDGIVSADRDFDRIPGLRRYDPVELAAG